MISHFLSLFALSSLALSQSTPAPVVTDNQYGVAYSVAINNGEGPLVGTFDFKALNPGVQIAFNINNFNISDNTSYTYHIHERPVPANGSCNATGEHFDPYFVGADHQCNPEEPNLCQLGDLSGKHGVISVKSSVPVFATSYQDQFLSTNEGNIAFFANLSIVVHRKRDGLRLNCGNFSQYGYTTWENYTTSIPFKNSTTSRPSSIPTWPGPVSALSVTTNATSTTSLAMATTPPGTVQPSVPTSSQTSSGSDGQFRNLAGGRVEASLWMLGLAATVPVIFL